MSKYEPLPQFLASVGGTAHRMSFNEIERVLGFKLPKSAYQHEAWWSNNATGHSHARAWLESGWRTEAVDLAARKVTFLRESNVASAPKSDPWGCMAGTITIMPDTDLTAPTGDVWNAEQGILLNE
jgi:Tfp pilus assembly protein PilX